jgi:hypothetical protein
LLRRDTQPASTAMSRISREDLEKILGAIDPHYLPEEAGIRDGPLLDDAHRAQSADVAGSGSRERAADIFMTILYFIALSLFLL